MSISLLPFTRARSSPPPLTLKRTDFEEICTLNQRGRRFLICRATTAPLDPPTRRSRSMRDTSLFFCILTQTRKGWKKYRLRTVIYPIYRLTLKGTFRYLPLINLPNFFSKMSKEGKYLKRIFVVANHPL